MATNAAITTSNDRKLWMSPARRWSTGVVIAAEPSAVSKPRNPLYRRNRARP
jgi:hypothetical protein